MAFAVDRGAGNHFHLRIAGAEAFGHVLEYRSILSVVEVSGFVADFDCRNQITGGRPEKSCKRKAVGFRIAFGIFPFIIRQRPRLIEASIS
jgi:hypothetical protein